MQLGACDLDAYVLPAEEQRRRYLERRKRLYALPTTPKPEPVPAPPPKETTTFSLAHGEVYGPVRPVWTPPTEAHIAIYDGDPPAAVIRISDVMMMVGRRFGITRRDMLSARRSRWLVEPRQIAMWLCRKYTLASLPEIGRRFGDRDHTTVINAIAKIEACIERQNDLGRRALEMEAAVLTSRPDLVG